MSNGIKINKIIELKSNKEKYLISSIDSGTIILSKVYWKGYQAYINRKKLDIINENGIIN